jgi:nucleoside-diphosphate-sugar epimerase
MKQMTSESAYRGKNVMVAGGAGFVGSALTRELLDVGANVSVYDNFLHGHRDNLDEVKNRITIYPGDVLDEWKLLDSIIEAKVDYLFDCIGDTYVPTAYDVPKRFFRINVEGTLNILLAAKRSKVKRVLYVSSTEVYGEARTPTIDEAHFHDPLNTYAVSKLAADRLCFTAHREHGIPVVIARIFNAYGPRETEPYVIPEIIAQLSRNDSVLLGNLRAKRDFTYVHDTARGLMALMTSSVPDGSAANVGSSVAYTVEEIARRIARIMGKPHAKIASDPRRLRRLDIDLFCCNPDYLYRMTGWKPVVGFDEGLRLTVRWFEEHGKRWSWEDFVDGTTMYR